MHDPPDVTFALVVCRSCNNIVGYAGQNCCPFCKAAPLRFTSYQALKGGEPLASLRPASLT